MNIEILSSKIHRATVTEANLEYDGSISVCPVLMEKANLIPFQKVDIVNINNGERFSTYIIKGVPQEICLNGAAARKVHVGDKIIIMSYVTLTPIEARGFSQDIVFVNEQNEVINDSNRIKK